LDDRFEGKKMKRIVKLSVYTNPNKLNLVCIEEAPLTPAGTLPRFILGAIQQSLKEEQFMELERVDKY
jgi:hypothetical protein